MCQAFRGLLNALQETNARFGRVDGIAGDLDAAHASAREAQAAAKEDSTVLTQRLDALTRKHAGETAQWQRRVEALERWVNAAYSAIPL